MKKIILMLVLVLVSLSCSKNEEKPNVLVPVYSKLNLTVNCEAMDSGELPIIKVGDDEVAYQNGEVFEKKYIAGQSIKIETELGSKYVLIGYEGDAEETNKSIDIVLNSDKNITVRLELKTKEVIPVGAVYTISTPSELRWLAEKSKTDKFENKTVKLANDINLRNYPFEGMWIEDGSYTSYFLGTFDGQGNEVSGLNIDIDAGDGQFSVGFIGYASQEAVVKNLAVSGKVQNKGLGGHTGGVVGNCSGGGIIENCYNAAEIIHTGEVGYVGGIVGGGVPNLKNVYNIGNITAGGEGVGGIAGYTIVGIDSSVIKSLYNIGAVQSKSEYVGGIAGYNESNNGFNWLWDKSIFLSTANINSDLRSVGNYPNSPKGFDVDKFASLDNFEGFDPAVWKIKTVKSVNGVSTRPVLIGVGEGRE